MVGIDLEEIKMISTVVCCLLRWLIAPEIEYKFYALLSKLSPLNPFTLLVCLNSTYRALWICIGPNFLVSFNQIQSSKAIDSQKKKKKSSQKTFKIS